MNVLDLLSENVLHILSMLTKGAFVFAGHERRRPLIRQVARQHVRRLLTVSHVCRAWNLLTDASVWPLVYEALRGLNRRSVERRPTDDGRWCRYAVLRMLLPEPITTDVTLGRIASVPVSAFLSFAPNWRYVGIPPWRGTPRTLVPFTPLRYWSLRNIRWWEVRRVRGRAYDPAEHGDGTTLHSLWDRAERRRHAHRALTALVVTRRDLVKVGQ